MDSILPLILATKCPVSDELPLSPSSSSSTTDNNDSNTEETWEDLPSNILFGLIKYLDLFTDIPHLRSVCGSWRSALPLSLLPSIEIAFQELPSLNLSYTTNNNNNIKDQPVFLRLSHFYLLFPTNLDDHTNNSTPNEPWIVKFNQIGAQRFNLLNPLNFDRYILTSPPLSAKISLLNTKSLQLSSPYSLVVGGAHPLDFKNGEIVSKKVVGGWNFQIRHFFNMLILLKNEFGGGLLCMRLGDLEWNYIKNDIHNTCTNPLQIADIVFYKNRFYAFELSTWQVGIIDTDCDLLESPSMKFRAAAPDISRVSKTDIVGVNFVPSNDHLYVVFEVVEYNATKLIVFVLDEHKWEWKIVNEISNEVFFIGSDVSFAVLADHLPRWKAGTVCLFNRPCFYQFSRYLKDSGEAMPVGAECMDAITYVKYEGLFWLFDMSDQEKGVVPFDEVDDNEAYTRLFFPPPSWVKWGSPSLGDVEVQLHNLKISDDDVEIVGSGDGDANGADEDVLEEIP